MKKEIKLISINREEMFDKLEKGFEVVHDYFSKDEYIYLDGDDRLRDENQYYMMRDNEVDFRNCKFFKDRPWETGWYVKEEM